MCSAVDWGISDEGRFYCRSCHNVIERTRDVVDTTVLLTSANRVSSLSKGSRNKQEGGKQWMVCDALQFILIQQAEALLKLGVCVQFKDDVLCQFWRLYLQKTRQAYTNNPIRSAQVRTGDSDLDRGPESSVKSVSDIDGDGVGSASGNCSPTSTLSGSADALSFLNPGQRRAVCIMPKTLALCYLALLWAREAITLADLLRLVNEGHVPYMKAHESLPDEMRLYGKDATFFKTECIPSYATLHREAHALAYFLELPIFPTITRDCLLHPSLLTLRYLTEVNLPDELYDWVCRVIEKAGMGDELYQTYHPQHSVSVLPYYDLQAVALIIITMKLLFNLDDSTEWNLSNNASDKNTDNPEENCFSLRRWYKMVESALTKARQRQMERIARTQWKSERSLAPSLPMKPVFTKKRRVAEHLQAAFQKLSGSSSSPPTSPPSSFCFRWGEEEGVDGPSLHHQRLDTLVVTRQGRKVQLSNPSYWHPALKICGTQCRTHYAEVKPTLPKTYVWLLELFSFLLGVKPEAVYEEVLEVERHFIKWHTNRPRQMPRKHKSRNKSRLKRTR